MSRYNVMLESHFSAHVCVGVTRDPHRDRPIRVFDIGEQTVAGVSDSVDAWIVSMGARINGVSVQSMFLNPQATGVSKRVRKQIFGEANPPFATASSSHRPRHALQV